MTQLNTPRTRNLIIAVSVLVVILIVVACAGRSASRRHLGWVSGVWSGDPSWMIEAQVGDFVLFVGPRDDASGESQGYLRIVGDDGTVVASQAFTLRARAPGRWGSLRAALANRPGADTFTIRAALEFDDAGGAEPPAPPPIPGNLMFSLSPIDGTLALLDDQKVYAFLAKDVYASSIALQAYRRGD